MSRPMREICGSCDRVVHEGLSGFPTTTVICEPCFGELADAVDRALAALQPVARLWRDRYRLER